MHTGQKGICCFRSLSRRTGREEMSSLFDHQAGKGLTEMERPAIEGGGPVRQTKLFYGHQYIDDADIEAVVKVLHSDFLTCGPEITGLEEKLCKLTGAGHADEAVILMEFAVSTSTDISRTYSQLADYWAARGRGDKIEEMKRIAKGLRSSNKGAILRHLKQSQDSIIGPRLF